MQWAASYRQAANGRGKGLEKLDYAGQRVAPQTTLYTTGWGWACRACLLARAGRRQAAGLRMNGKWRSEKLDQKLGWMDGWAAGPVRAGGPGANEQRAGSKLHLRQRVLTGGQGRAGGRVDGGLGGVRGCSDLTQHVGIEGWLDWRGRVSMGEDSKDGGPAAAVSGTVSGAGSVCI